MTVSRETLVDILNDCLEADHDITAKVFLGPIQVNELSPLYHKARDDRGLRVVSGIDLLSEVLGTEIVPVIEDGIVQGFILTPATTCR